MMRRFFPSTIRQVSADNSLFPNEVTGLEFWFDVSDGTTITKDGADKVSQLDDKSVNGFNLSQITPANQPLWVADQFKGFDVIRFTKANAERMLTGNLINARDFFAVVKPVNDSSGNEMMSLFGGGVSVYYSLDRFSGFTRFVNRNSGAFVINDAAIIDPDGGSIYNYYNPTVGLGHLFTSNSPSQTNTGTAHGFPRTFGLGVRSSAAAYGSFDFLEVFGYQTEVSDDDREKLWQYLADKYSLTKPTL